MAISSDVQDAECAKDFIETTCYIDGSFLENSIGLLNISGPQSTYFKLHLTNFKYLQSSQFVELIHVKDLQIENSTLEIVSNSSWNDCKVNYLNIINCTLNIQSLNNFKKLTILTMKNVEIVKINPAAFTGLTKISFLGFTDIKMTNELSASFKNLKLVIDFRCARCGITDKYFLKILQNLKSAEILSFPSNSIKSVKCDEIARLEMNQLSIDSNELYGIFPTCGVPIVVVSENKIDTLFIHSGTESLDASINVISSIKCYKFLNLTYLKVAGNLLSDLMCVSDISSLQELNIDSNKFTFFKNYDFEKLTNLKILSALDNPILSLRPNLFSFNRKNVITRITVDGFDSGYGSLAHYYPKLTEVFHKKINGSCEDYNKILNTLKSQNISLYLLKTINCTLNSSDGKLKEN